MAATKWVLDPTHAEIQFKVRHLMITTVTGSFKKFDATMETSKEDFSDAKISFSAETDSVDTNDPRRDGHLKGGDFFDSVNHPKLSFTSTSIVKKGEGEFKLDGNLTIRDITKPVSLHVTHMGTMTDGYGNTKAGFEAEGKISRKEWNMVFNIPMENGGMVVSDEVKLVMNVQMTKQVETAKEVRTEEKLAIAS